MSTANFSDDGLRREFLRMRREGEGSENCPTLDSLWESARAGLQRDENEELLLHLGGCPACAAAWRFAQEVSPDDSPVPLPVRKVRIARRSWFPIAAVAATVMVAAGLGAYLLIPDRDGSAVYRTQESEWLQPAIADGSSLPRDDFVLEWGSGPEGTWYDIRVVGEDMKPLARGTRLRQAEFVVAEELLGSLQPGSVVYWQVTAHLPDGRTLESQSFITGID